MPELAITDLTDGTTAGNGIFDQMMRSIKAHLSEEYNSGRMQGTDYATVYLGSLQSVLSRAQEFLFARERIGLENELLQLQVQQAELERQRLEIAVQIAEAERGKLMAETVLLVKELEKVDADIALTQANISRIQRELPLVDAQVRGTNASTDLTGAQTDKVISDKALVDESIKVTTEQIAQTQAATVLTTRQGDNAIKEGELLDAQVCETKARFDLLVEQVVKTTAETGVLNQKRVTEQAQTNGSGVDDDSVIGRQKQLFKNQADGFIRDAEQKAARLMVDSWNVRRTTDEGTVADGTNRLDDASIGRVVQKLLEGVGA